MIESMKDLFGVVFMTALFVGLPAFCTWLVFKGIRTGVVRAKGFPYARADSPVFFWVTIATYAAIAFWISYYGVLIGLDILKNP